MTDANEMCESVNSDQDELVGSDTDDTKEEGFSCHEEPASGDIPSSLLSYFESSKSRAATWEKFILEDLGDVTVSCLTEDGTPIELNKGMMKVNEQIFHLTEDVNNKTDHHLLYDPGEMQTLYTHDGSMSPNNEGDTEALEYIENQNYLTMKIREFDAEEIQKKEQRRQREADFQEELRKIIEAEKLQQMELELMAKGAQEKLEEEFLVQQELISNLKKRVDKERSMIEEEQKKHKEEEEVRRGKEKAEKRRREEEEQRKRKEKEDKTKNEEEHKRKRQEERKQKDEEKRKTEEMTLKEEDRTKKEEEQMKKKGEEEKRKREEEEHKLEEEKKENEERKKKEMQMREEERRNEETKPKEKRKSKDDKELIMVTGKKLMEDEKGGSKEEEERKREDEEEVRITKEPDVTMKHEEMEKKVEDRKSEEERGTSHADNKMMHEQMRRIEEGGEEKRMDKEKRHSVEDKYMTGKEEEKKIKVYELEQKGEVERKRRNKEELRVTKELAVRIKQEMGKNEVEGRSEEDGIKTEVENKMMDKQMRREEERGEEKRMVEEKRHGMENVYMRGKEEQKTKEEEQTEELEKEIKRQKEEEYRNREEDIKLQIQADNKENEDERNRKDHQETQEERKNIEKEDGTRSVKADKRHNEGGVSKNIESGERRLEESDISKRDTEKNDNTGHPLKPALTSSGPAPSHGDSADCPSNSETLQQPDQTISQTTTYKTTDQSALSLSTSCSPAACLSDHTEQKRLAWMKDCIPWSKLSLQNRRKPKARVQGWRGPRRAADLSSLPPLCTHTLLQSTGCRSLQELTTVTLEDLPGCSLSTLAQCPQLRSLTLRRCGLRSLEGISRLRELHYIDLQENEISHVECENMPSLRVLRLAHNKLTSIHGLSGADNLDILDLSHNSISRIAGLESVRRLQRLSLHHNQLISTKGLKDVYTLLDLDCSHNHLARVEGLENSALLHTLDLRANSLSEPPSLNNQVLLRELHLDDNSISSLQDLSACWLPLLQHLSAAQNRITQLPSMSDFVSLENLDLRFNCLSEVQNVCDNLEGCQFLQEVQLTGNPLQQEHGWRATLQKALPGLSAIDRQQTDSFLSPPAVQQVALASGCFLTFCQAQLQHTRDLQQHHSRELSNASSSLDALMRHFTMTLKLAEEQRFAHEYGDTTVCDEHWATVQTQTETLEVDTIVADYPKTPPVIRSRNNLRRSYWGSEETPAAESWLDAFDGVKMGPEPSFSKLNSGSVLFLAAKGKTTSFNLEKEPVSNQHDLHLKNTAAVVIQQHWRNYKQKFGNLHGPPIAEKGGERGGDGTPEWGPSFINQSAVGHDYAATVIQAYWRGFSLRRRLASALAAVTWPDAGQDDTFEEVNVDEFIFDEAVLEKDWTFSENSPPRHPVSQQPLSLKPPGPCIDSSQCILPPPLAWSPMQAWVAGEHVDSAAQRISPQSSNRSKSPASTSVLGGLSERSEKILEEWGFTDSHTALLMLKRAQKMKPKTEQKKHRDPSIRLALFRNKQLQQSPVEARNRPARQMRNYVKVGEAGLGLQQGEETEQAQRWLHTQAAQSDRHSESERFLPEINASILNGGRVQLVADPAYAEHLHHASGSLANCSLAAQSYKVNSYTRGNSSGHARKEAPSPKRVTSAPVKKERISFRDNPVQLSGGWGGGKKRDRLYK